MRFVRSRRGILGALLIAAALLTAGCGAQTSEQAGLYAPDLNDEYKVGGTAWQVSAESRALMEQAFSAATANVYRMMDRCLDPEDADWVYDADENAMYYQGKRAAVITDIDDTMVVGAGYNCDQVANDGDGNSVAFARFAMSDACTPCSGALDFIRVCEENGIEVFYVTNRSDKGYAIGESDSAGSYEETVGDGTGAYVGKDGAEIDASIYQCLGKSAYDITMESMADMGFPVDDQHLILNDSYLNGSSKEPARQAITNGDASYPNGQRAEENTIGSAVYAAIRPHSVVMLVGDTMGDFTDAFSADGLDAVSRADLTEDYADKFGTEWIVLPNAMYGTSYSYAERYGLTELLQHYSYR